VLRSETAVDPREHEILLVVIKAARVASIGDRVTSAASAWRHLTRAHTYQCTLTNIESDTREVVSGVQAVGINRRYVVSAKAQTGMARSAFGDQYWLYVYRVCGACCTRSWCAVKARYKQRDINEVYDAVGVDIQQRINGLKRRCQLREINKIDAAVVIKIEVAQVSQKVGVNVDLSWIADLRTVVDSIQNAISVTILSKASACGE